MASNGMVASVLRKRGKQLHAEWLKALASTPTATASGRIPSDGLDKQCGQFLLLLAAAAESKHYENLQSAHNKPLREFLEATDH